MVPLQASLTAHAEREDEEGERISFLNSDARKEEGFGFSGKE